MHRLPEFFRRLWYLLNRRRLETALREEMDAHRAEMADPRRFGNSRALQEQAAEAWGWRWLDDLRRDVRLGLRTLRRSPGFTALSLGILTVGTGLNLVAFQVIDLTLLAPLPVNDPASLVQLRYRGEHFESTGVPYPLAMAVREHSNVLAGVLVSRPVTLGWRDLGDDVLPGDAVSSNWFEDLGGRPEAGRLLHVGVDDLPGAATVVILARGLWTRRFGADPTIVGHIVHLNGRPVIVAGVAPAGFTGAEADGGQYWLPIEHLDDVQPGSGVLTDWATQSVSMFGRLRPGTTGFSAKAESAGLFAQLASAHPKVIDAKSWLEPYSGAVRFRPAPVQTSIRRIAGGVAALALVVLLVSCLNLGNLTLARAIARLRELSIRTALGAGRWRVVRYQVLESAILGIAGTAGGLVFCVGLRSLVGEADGPPIGAAFDWRLGLAGVAAALMTTVGVGFAPAWKIGRQDLTLATRDGGDRLSQSLRRTRLRQWLVAGQVAGSCALLLFAGQMLQSLERALAGRATFSVDRLIVVEPARDGLRAAERPDFWRAVQDRLSPVPGIERMALASDAPLGFTTSTTEFKAAPKVWFQVFGVDPMFLRTMGIAVRRGRNFDAHDGPDAVIVSRHGAIAMFGTDDVIGRPFPWGPAGRVMGVTEDAQLSRQPDRGTAELYVPLQLAEASTLVVRTSGDPAASIPSVRLAARASSASVATDVHPLSGDYDDGMRPARVAATAAGLAALLALLLASAGIFGVVAASIGARVQEIGIRLALGASGASLRRLLLRTTWISLAGGAAAGFYAGWALVAAFMQQPFYLESPTPARAAAVGLLLLAIGATAAVMPVRRILRADPLVALRHD
jgi:predicted permease